MRYQRIYQKLAKFYDTIYGNEFHHKYAIFIRKIIKENKIKNPLILDVACGTGKLIYELKKNIKDLSIEGLDSSKQMLRIAKAKNKKFKYYNQNLINFRTKKKYDIITCAFDSLNYLIKIEDLDKTLKNVYGHLKNNGLFIFDFNTIHKKTKKFVREDKVCGYSITYYSSFKDKYWNIIIEMKKGQHIYKEHHRERLYSLKEMKSALDRNKLRIIKINTNLDNKKEKLDKVPRLFIVAQK